jgi:hypothetical protein
VTIIIITIISASRFGLELCPHTMTRLYNELQSKSNASVETQLFQEIDDALLSQGPRSNFNNFKCKTGAKTQHT